MAYTTIDDPSAYFHTQLYVGNESTNAITNNANAGNFQPDWWWGADRTSTSWNSVFDSSRGTTKQLNSNVTNSEYTVSTSLTSFDSNGFTLGSHDNSNGNSENHVAWQWKANGGTTASNTDGTITSTVQANTDAGFSIVTYTGTGSNATIGHGLGSAPTMVIVKNRSSAESWMVGHHKNSNGFQSALFLDLTAAKDTDAVYFNNTAPSSTVVSIGTNTKINHASENHVMYVFAEKQGYSKFGSYEGNNNADGTFVYLGFKPSFMLIKNIDGTNNWMMLDNKRDTDNPILNALVANGNNAEFADSGDLCDFLSNGVKMRVAGQGTNNAATFIYMAFAEHPFVSSEGVPTTAR